MLFFNQEGFNGCWCINTISEIPKENQRIRSEIQGQKEQLIVVIEKIIKDNLPQKSSEERNRLAKQIYLLYEGAVAESHLHKDNWPIKSARSICKQII